MHLFEVIQRCGARLHGLIAEGHNISLVFKWKSAAPAVKVADLQIAIKAFFNGMGITIGSWEIKSS